MRARNWLLTVQTVGARLGDIVGKLGIIRILDPGSKEQLFKAIYVSGDYVQVRMLVIQKRRKIVQSRRTTT